MLMPCLIAQAISFIHLFGLQLCVAMDPPIDSGSHGSIQNPVDYRANKLVAFLTLDPSIYAPGPQKVYYVTVAEINNRMRLKLTDKDFEALPIGNSESGLNLPVRLSDFTTFDGYGGLQVEARQDSIQGRRLEFLAGKIKLSENDCLYLHIASGLLYVKYSPDDEARDHYHETGYQEVVQRDPSRFGTYDQYIRQICYNNIKTGAAAALSAACLAYGYHRGSLAAVAFAGGALFESGRGLYVMSKIKSLLWMDLKIQVD